MKTLKRNMMLVLFMVGTLMAMALNASNAKADSCPAFLDHDMRKLHSSDLINLCDVAEGKPVLVVNTASHCGYTGQFEGLEALHKQYQADGLVVVALTYGRVASSISSA